MQPVSPIRSATDLSVLHEGYMQRCLQLATMGSGYTAPNPLVGAVLVHDNRIIGEGYHRQYGGPHAEVNCINSVSETDRDLISSATMYVSLEPCAHHGKTPPCADLIIRHKIPRVVIGCRDPFPEVDGKGIEKLLANNVGVVYPVMEREAIEVNRRFFTFHLKKRPYIILKWAESANRLIAGSDGEHLLISNEYSNRLVHRWRTEEAAILVGTNTALRDNPRLTARLWPGKNPLRLVLDRTLKLPAALNLFDQSSDTVVLNTIRDEKKGAVRLKLIDDHLPLTESIIQAAFSMNILSILVEGGAKLLQTFIDAGLWDEARIITNENLHLSAGINAPRLKNAWLSDQRSLSGDNIRFYRNKDQFQQNAGY